MTNLTILTKQIRLHDGLYSLNDLHKAAGGACKHKPANFIRIDQTKELIAEIEQDANLHYTNQCSDMRSAFRVVNGGRNRGTYVCKELVYAYAMWINPKFHLAVIRAFDQMYLGEQAQAHPQLLKQAPQLTKEDLYHLITVPGSLSLEDLSLLSELINQRYLETIKAHKKVLNYFTKK